LRGQAGDILPQLVQAVADLQSSDS
jgi:hypothetical protein